MHHAPVVRTGATHGIVLRQRARDHTRRISIHDSGGQAPNGVSAPAKLFTFRSTSGDAPGGNNR
jgi:hypothetical protein